MDRLSQLRFVQAAIPESAAITTTSTTSYIQQYGAQPRQRLRAAIRCMDASHQLLRPPRLSSGFAPLGCPQAYAGRAAYTDSDIARLCERAQDPVRQEIYSTLNRIRDLKDSVFEHSQRANVNDLENIDLHNRLLDNCSRTDKQAYANKTAIEDLQLELRRANLGWALAMCELKELKRQLGPRAKTIETRPSSSAKPVETSSSFSIRSTTVAKTRTLTPA